MYEDEKRVEAILAEKLKSSAQSGFGMAFEAACVLRTLERGSEYQKACCEPLIQKLRKTTWANAIDLHVRLPDTEFLERFIEAHAPRKEADGGAVENPNEDRRNYEQDNERIANLRAETERFSKAIRNRFITAAAPDSGMLLCLRQIRPNDPTTWPTLRELKVATAIPERTIKRIVANLRPKPRQAEIVTIPLRHMFSKRGALPLRYGPRLVVAVLKEFVNRLPKFPIDNEEQKRLRKIATCVKRALTVGAGRSRSST
jgi:hypothetical protein